MSQKMKVIMIERTRVFRGNWDLVLDKYEVSFFNLHENQVIIVHDEDCEWSGVVKFDCEADQWYVVVDEKTEREVSEEVQEAWTAAYMNGACTRGHFEKRRISSRLIRDGFSVDEVHKYTQLEKEELHAIKASIQRDLEKDKNE